MKTFFEMVIGFALALVTMLIGFMILKAFDIETSGANFFVGWVSCTVYHFAGKIFDNWSKERNETLQ